MSVDRWSWTSSGARSVLFGPLPAKFELMLWSWPMRGGADNPKLVRQVRAHQVVPCAARFLHQSQSHGESHCAGNSPLPYVRGSSWCQNVFVLLDPVLQRSPVFKIGVCLSVFTFYFSAKFCLLFFSIFAPLLCLNIFLPQVFSSAPSVVLPEKNNILVCKDLLLVHLHFLLAEKKKTSYFFSDFRNFRNTFLLKRSRFNTLSHMSGCKWWEWGKSGWSWCDRCWLWVVRNESSCPVWWRNSQTTLVNLTIVWLLSTLPLLSPSDLEDL